MVNSWRSEYSSFWNHNSLLEPISVVMSAFESSRTVRLAIRSTLLSLDSFDELIVVVNEGDTKTLEAILRIRDSRILLVNADRAASFSAKLNLGVLKSRNNLIARMDADDITLPWRFWLQRRAMSSGKHAIHCSTVIVFGASLRPLPMLPQLPIPLKSPEVNEQLCFTNPIPHPTVVIRRDVLVELGGYLDKPGEDMDLWLRAALIGVKIRRMAIPTVLYRFSKTSLSRNVSVKKAIEEDPKFQKYRLELADKLGLIRKGSNKQFDADLAEGIDSTGLKLRWKTRIAMLSLGLNS